MNQVNGQARATLEIYMKLIKIALLLIILSVVSYFIYIDYLIRSMPPIWGL